MANIWDPIQELADFLQFGLDQKLEEKNEDLFRINFKNCSVVHFDQPHTPNAG